MTLNFNAQGHLVNSTLGNEPISGSYSNITNELTFVVPGVNPIDPPTSYRGYFINDNLCGLWTRTYISGATLEGGWLAGGGNGVYAAGPVPINFPRLLYFIFFNGQAGSLDGLPDFVDATLSINGPNPIEIPITGMYDNARDQKLTFAALLQVGQTFTFYSFTGYLMSVKYEGASVDVLLAGIMDQTVVEMGPGGVSVSESETGWWAEPGPI
jgi:hypothetical protein